MVEHIHNHPRLGARTLFATHYHELTELEKYLPRVRNYNVAVVEEGDEVIIPEFEGGLMVGRMIEKYSDK